MQPAKGGPIPVRIGTPPPPNSSTETPPTLFGNPIPPASVNAQITARQAVDRALAWNTYHPDQIFVALVSETALTKDGRLVWLVTLDGGNVCGGPPPDQPASSVCGVTTIVVLLDANTGKSLGALSG